ncbi:LVIVD repeat-containing protein [Agromyces archimandritae]|uniref:LVIVD repeat-containing protein n=1 Tax=Agromyces archimandritae TaxID=2781962 RepID=A0A975FM67_9MICO|nr:hypothetical protein [Agromyces archimandritae]QTX04469.1 hypothetical protein G127AT_14565 [Agromyces archimandritae]
MPRRAAGRAARPALGVAIAAALALLLAPAAPAASADASVRAAPTAADGRDPVVSGPLEWVAHRDNPFRSGDDPDFINSDLAFSGDHLVQGNFDGFSVWDIAEPADPELLAAVVCPGGQGDVSAAGELVFFSVDEPMSNDGCDAGRVAETEPHWEGIRIFDLSDPRHPEYVAAVHTRCGSHTHTLVPDPARSDVVYLYISSYSRGDGGECQGRNPVQIVEVPLADPAAARVANTVDYFDDATAFGPGDRVPGGAETRATTGCHDMTAYPAKGLAVAACRGDGVLLDIADPLHPRVLQRVRDPAVAFWHSGIFANDGSAVVFQDELGDGFINTCSPAFGADRGADTVWGLADGRLERGATFKIARVQDDAEKCVAHSGGVVPVPDRFVVAQAWLEGGVSIIDFTDPAAPVEIASFDRPGYGYSMDFTAGIWSVYFYNGYLFASDMYDGLEVLRLTGPEFADAARYVSGELNPQTQPEFSWVWREAPVVPADAGERAALPVAELSPASVPPGVEEHVVVRVPAGVFEPGETVDVWWMPEQRVLTTGTADADGAFRAELAPGALAAGAYGLAVRGDRSAPAFAYAVLEAAEAADAAVASVARVDAGASATPWIAVIGAAGLLGAGALVVWSARRQRAAVRRRAGAP